MRKWMTVLCVFLAGASCMKAELKEEDLTPYEQLCYMASIMASTTNMIDGIGLCRSDVCLRGTTMTGPKRISFNVQASLGTIVFIHAMSSHESGDMDLLVYDSSGTLIASNTELNKYAYVTFKANTDTYFEVILIRADYSTKPAPCMVAIYENKGYITSEKRMINTHELAIHPRKSTKLFNVPSDCIRPVTLSQDWLVLGFTLAPREAMTIPMQSEPLPTGGGYSAVVACDAVKADITISTRNRAGQLVRTNEANEESWVGVTWVPQRGENYTARVVNTGTNETLVLFSQFANDARFMYTASERLKDKAPPAKSLE